MHVILVFLAMIYSIYKHEAWELQGIRCSRTGCEMFLSAFKTYELLHYAMICTKRGMECLDLKVQLKPMRQHALGRLRSEVWDLRFGIWGIFMNLFHFI
jgi:hypothetical protein